MVNVDIDRDLYDDIKKLIKKNKYDYPSVKFFVQKAVHKEIISKNNSGNNVDDFYSRLRETLQNHPELRLKIDEIYAAEVKKLKKVSLND